MFQKLRPARTQAQDDPQIKILCDFDALVSQTVGFKFKGKSYVLENVSVENYMIVTIAYRNLLLMVEQRSQGEALSEESVYQKYFDLIHPLAPAFTYDDLKQLPFVLLNQLVNLIFRQLAGDPSLYGQEEKKNPQNLTRL